MSEQSLGPEGGTAETLHVINTEKHGRTESGQKETQVPGMAGGRGSIWTNDRSRALSVLGWPVR